MDDFGGRVALVTAAAGAGVGQAVARRLAAAGADVVVTDSHPRRTREVAAAITDDYPGVRVLGVPLDVGSADSAQRALAEVARSFGPIRILVNNAAVNTAGGIVDHSPEDWERAMQVNLTGVWRLCRAVMPQMREAGGGVIVNISSIAADLGGLGIEAPYAVSKGGLAALSRSCAHEGGPHGIRSVVVSTGLIRGTRWAAQNPQAFELPEARGPLGTFPDPSDIAEAVAFLASERARCITGEILNVAAGAYMRN